jgi:ABC-type Mn2+/Zn2+ transport system ATPase subunit
MEGIELKNLTVGYSFPLFSNLSLKMEEGEFWVIVGPNGVGKSTLVKTILGIVPPLGGRIFIHGVDCTNGCDEKRFLSYVPQMENYSHSFPATALEVVLSGFFPKKSRFEGIKEEEVEKALRWLKILDLEEKANEPFNKLSGGQQRKVLIARALISDPHYIFFDEPTTGVDLKSSRKILGIINDLHKEKGFGICMVTHDLNPVWEYIDNVILIGHKGKYFAGSKEELLNRDVLSEIYEVEVKVLETDYGPVFLVGDKHV